MITELGRRIGIGCLAASLMVFCSGCFTCKPGKAKNVKAYDIQVAVDPTLKNDSIVVDLVGVTSRALEDSWSHYSMTDYWKSGDTMRRDNADDTISLDFLSGQSLSQTLSVTNKIWNVWKQKKATHVLVMAKLPGLHKDMPGSKDARRQVLSLDKCVWLKSKTKTLEVVVKRSGIYVETPLRATEP